MDKDVQRAAEEIVAKMELDFNVAQALLILPGVAELHRELFNQMMRQGYTNAQAYKFASEFVLQIMKSGKEG